MNDALFKKLTDSVKQAGAIRRGARIAARATAFKPDDVRTIRERLDLSQADFALMIGVSVGTLRNWEQGRRQPDGPARALLRVASAEPEAVARALRAA